MQTSLKWIKSMVKGLDVTPKEYMDAMTLSGSKVEFYTELGKDLEKIVVGEIKKVERHPDADRLVVCQVDVGSEQVQIVTGAPNIVPNESEGQKVPVVLDGGRVRGDHDGNVTPGGVKIKKGKLRGVESFGMMCSREELGLAKDMYPDADENGIWILDKDAEVGQNIVDYFGLDDAVVEYEITSNRIDCFGVIGIAREAAATFKCDFMPPEIPKTGDNDDVNNYVKVRVEAEDLCPRYTARVVKNIRLAPSPDWMQQRLRAHGIRPINNIVDITNYVMEEYGQPMHAYDLDTIAGHEIVVKRANDGDKFVTLDGVERDVDNSVLMICDGEKAVGLAGIMGGENSMITDDVTTMLFEAANFDGTNIRLSSKKVGLRTDASGKFEKGLDIYQPADAINRACALIEELDAGDVVGGMIDVCAGLPENRVLPFEPEKYNHMLGTNVAEAEMIEYFDRLEVKYNESDKSLTIPSFRKDLESYADLAEEVARFYGYDKIPTTLPKGEATTGGLSPKLAIEKMAKEAVRYMGFSQSMNYSFESPKVYDRLLISADDKLRDAVVISNPLGEDYSIMRTQPLDGMLRSLSTNANRRNKSAKLFEMANIYIPKSLPVTELPDERMTLSLGMYGEGDFFDLKGVCEELLELFGIGRAGSKNKVSYDPSVDLAFLHPGKKAAIKVGDKELGYIGEVHPKVCKNYDIKQRVYVLVLDMPNVSEATNFDTKYTGVAKYPAATRDLSMMVPKSVLAADVESVFDKFGGKYLESYELFDIYEGEQIDEGFKSMAYSLSFRSSEGNLKDEDFTGDLENVLKQLEVMGVSLRK